MRLNVELRALMKEDAEGGTGICAVDTLGLLEDYARLEQECERLRDECLQLNKRRENLALRVLGAESERDAALKQVDELRSDLLFLAEYIAAESTGNPLPNYLAMGRFPVDVARAALSAKP